MADSSRHPDLAPADPGSAGSTADTLRRRSRSFGTNAALYDRTRPTYPAALIEDLLRPGPRAILDVGCGTGRAARLVGGPGRTVMGIEPDGRMAAVAVEHGIEVEIGSFETWDPAGRQFDLLISAQAWHWVDPVAGAAKAADVLRPGGCFAAFWNVMHHVREVRAVFESVYSQHAPQLLLSSVALGVEATVRGRSDVAAAALAAAPFQDVTENARITYEWLATYSPSRWVGLLRTHSDHQILDPPTREALLLDLQTGLAALGPSFPIEFRTDLLRATRR